MSPRSQHQSATDETVSVPVPVRSTGFRTAKRLLQTLFLLLVMPRYLVFRVWQAAVGRRAFLGASESIARIPGLRGVYLRQAFYRKVLEKCGRDVYFGWNSVLSMTEARIGDEVYIGRFCSLGYADIGDGAMLADGVQILSGGNEHGSVQGGQPLRDQAQRYQRVRIGPHAWLGANCIIMADVGEGAVVGAGAVVTRPIAPRSIVGGVPARPLNKE